MLVEQSAYREAGGVRPSERCPRCNRHRGRQPEAFTEGMKTCDRCRADRQRNRNKTKHPRGENHVTRAVICGRRFCSDCGTWRHTVDFGVATWWDPIEREHPKYFRQVCHHCERIRGRVRNARLAGRSEPYGQWKPGRLSKEERNKRSVERHKKRMEIDSVYAERFRERQRIWAEAKRRERGVLQRQPGLKLPGYGEKLDPMPLKDWFDRKLGNGYAGNISLLASRCQIEPRALTRVITLEHKHVSEDFVDHVLLHEGSTFMWELYPALYDEAA